jgi:hypothetical protein
VYKAAGHHLQKGTAQFSMQEFKQFLTIAFTDIRTYIALGSLVLAIIAYRRHKRKRLAYQIVSNESLFSIKRLIKDRIKIYLDDTLVENVNLVLIRIFNPGNDTITTKDFESSIAVNFGDAAKILSVEISEKSPADLPATISYNDSSVMLEPLLLNEKDSVTLKALVSKPQNAIIVGGRIAGVRKIEDGTYSDERIKYVNFVFQTILLLVIVSLSITGVEIAVIDPMKNLGITPRDLGAIKLIVMFLTAACCFYVILLYGKRTFKR